MKATDFMIGDWVYASKDEHTVLKVMTINGNTAGCIWDVNNECDMNIDEFEPIPITPKILEKNGFKQTDKGGGTCIAGEWRWGDKGKRNFTVVTITFYKGLNSGVRLLTKIETDCSYESGINMVHSCDIESVHDLQHALKLCGIDKEITL